MKGGSIPFSPKHGVNPSLMQCFVCMKDVGVALLGRLKGDQEAPRRVCLDREPCDECLKFMKMGVILISVKDGEEGNNPYRTGGWVVVKEEAVGKIITSPELAKEVIKMRMAFVPDEAWDKLGLPGGRDAEES